MSVILFILLSIFFVTVGQKSNPGDKPALAGVYYANDTARGHDYCRHHSLVLKADSTFEYHSPCLVSEGKWTYENNRILLTSPPQSSLGTGRLRYDKYDNTHNGIRVKVTGKNGKPIVCEEIKCIAAGKQFTQFTDKEGCVYFPVEKFDTIVHISLSEYFRNERRRTGRCGEGKCDEFIPWNFTKGSYELIYSVNNDYQHYAAFSKLPFKIQNGQLIPDPKGQGPAVTSGLPQVPFGKLVKKK